MEKLRKKETSGQAGQSIVEYTILAAAVIAALIAFLAKGGVLERATNTIIIKQGDDLVTMTDKIFF